MHHLSLKPKVFGMTYPYNIGDIIQCIETHRIGTVVAIHPFTTYTLLRVMWSDTGAVSNIDADHTTLLVGNSHKFV